MPTHKWSDIKRSGKVSPERIEQIDREVRQQVARMRQPPFAYDWQPGERGAIGFPEQHGLEDDLVDVIEVEPARLLVSDGERQAWVPRELVGQPEDFGIIDDTSYERSLDQKR